MRSTLARRAMRHAGTARETGIPVPRRAAISSARALERLAAVDAERPRLPGVAVDSLGCNLVSHLSIPGLTAASGTATADRSTIPCAGCVSSSSVTCQRRFGR